MLNHFSQGSPSQINEMLALAATQDIHPWIIKRPMKEVNQAVPDMHKGLARYRYVLVNEENGGKL
jgi:alcohol dehydrogenase (NADP+)